ncbi:MAG: hypothetical protein J4215_00730 [Candidatus Diapherotrites archaeon]|uniref:S-layer protein n=1 Tax=Candidatus Iainarchaeum sp. TaxID=3101447 RepID=A0A8T4L3G9_9ARCH|nr:hypothetical protein [Candidatus Diapherotrites archaeon]
MTAEYNKHVRLFGTDTGELGQIISTDPQYYFPDVLDIGGNPADNSFSVAQLAIDENNTTGTYDMNVYIDSATHKTVTFPNVNLSNYSSDVNFNGTWEYSMSLRNDEPYLHQAYTDWGSKVVLADGVVTATMPQNRRYIDLIVGGSATTTTPTGGDDLTGLTLNTTQTTPSGTKVTVTNVTGTCAAGGACTPASYEKVVPLQGNLVFTDVTRPAGKVIIVGGYLVNSLARNLTLADNTTLQDALTKSGDMKAEKLPNGDMIVAGYTADDTGRAAQDLINTLDALVQ